MSSRGVFALAMLTATAIGAGATLGGCAAEEQPRIPLGEAGSATPIRLAAKPDRTGLLPMSKWPAACDLLPEPAVREILPAATVVEMKRVTPTFETGDLGSRDRVFPGDASCHIGIDFAGAERRESRDYPAYIYVTVRAAGTPELARKNYDEKVVLAGKECPADLVAATGLDGCAEDIGKWAFLKNGITGELSGLAPLLNDGVYFEGQKENTYADQIWRGTVETEMLKAVAARLP
ncbi:hypothetical protein AB0G04_25045 [Actinoplanes sp. NPDC023801]|uniref:hypothetical protein n=1 Tax=Actinoplanes sp. NPDC023801 TaxID=3154595 RepID=UPI0033F97FF1